MHQISSERNTGRSHQNQFNSTLALIERNLHTGMVSHCEVFQVNLVLSETVSIADEYECESDP